MDINNSYLNIKKRIYFNMGFLVKKKRRKKLIYYILDKLYSNQYIKYSTINKNEKTVLINNYNDFINKCFKYLDYF